MKLLHALSGIVLFLLVLALGVYLVYTGFGGEYPVVRVRDLAAMPVYRVGVGAVAIFVVMLFALTAIPRGKEKRFLSFEGDGGTISISVSAVTVFLSRLADEFAGIVSLEADIVSRTEPIEVRLDVKVKAGSNVPELCKMLQQQVRANLNENFGLSDIGAVKVNVHEVVIQDKRAPNSGERADW